MVAEDDFTQADTGLVMAGFVAGLFNQDTTSIAAGDALVMEGTTDFRVQQADTALARNCVGWAETASLQATPVAGDAIAVVPRGALVKALIDATTDIVPGDLLVLATGGAVQRFTDFAVSSPSYTPSVQQTEFNKVYTVVAMALQNHDTNGDFGVIMTL